MSITPVKATLPQLLNRYQAAVVGIPHAWLEELSRLTYHSMAIEGTCLTFSQTRSLLQTGQLLPDQSLTHQWQMIDHHQALQQILIQASQHEPLNRVALQAIAATLMARTGGLVFSWFQQIDTRKANSAWILRWPAEPGWYRPTNYPRP